MNNKEYIESILVTGCCNAEAKTLVSVRNRSHRIRVCSSCGKVVK